MNAGLQLKRAIYLRDLEAAELQRFQVAHHARTGEVLSPEEARPLLKRARELQMLQARDDMVSRLAHARKMLGAQMTDAVPEEGMDPPALSPEGAIAQARMDAARHAAALMFGGEP